MKAFGAGHGAKQSGRIERPPTQEYRPFKTENEPRNAMPASIDEFGRKHVIPWPATRPN
jgi:hypothetical protein